MNTSIASQSSAALMFEAQPTAAELQEIIVKYKEGLLLKSGEKAKKKKALRGSLKKAKSKN